VSTLVTEPGGWAQYIVLLGSTLLAMTIPLGVQLISFLLGGGKKTGRSATKPAENAEDLAGQISDQVAPDIKLNSRYFLAANITLLLFVLALMLVPLVAVMRSELRAQAAVSVGGVLVALVLSVLYLVRKGDLHWVRSFFRN
jgi:NADH:ubiquinone oxidoreductase subunit 3 (subunit A)